MPSNSTNTAAQSKYPGLSNNKTETKTFSVPSSTFGVNGKADTSAGFNLDIDSPVTQVQVRIPGVQDDWWVINNSLLQDVYTGGGGSNYWGVNLRSYVTGSMLIVVAHVYGNNATSPAFTVEARVFSYLAPF